MDNARKAQLVAEIYAKGIGTYRGYILEYIVDESVWVCGASLRSGVIFETPYLVDAMGYIDVRES
jgi:hypothetical protein